jgi:hypothetical protein
LSRFLKVLFPILRLRLAASKKLNFHENMPIYVQWIAHFFLEGVPGMRQEKLITMLIDLEERANAHTAEYQRLLNVPKSRTIAARHRLKALRLQSRIQGLIREIALCGGASSSSAFSKESSAAPPGLP